MLQIGQIPLFGIGLELCCWCYGDLRIGGVVILVGVESVIRWERGVGD